jgi:hypothetical protein
MGDGDEPLTTRVCKFKFTQFDAKTEEWRYYIQRFELELTLQNITGTDGESVAAKRNLLLKWVGPDLYRLVVDHFHPTALNVITYDQLITFLNGYYKPTTNYLAERAKFGKCYRKPEQTITQYLSDLRSLAIGCKFGGTLEERLRDQFLLGLQNPTMQEELFRRHPEDDALLAVIEADALLLESAYNQRKQFELGKQQALDGASASVAKVQRQQPKKSATKNTGAAKGQFKDDKLTCTLDSTKQCLRCGGQRHTKDQKCPAQHSTCRAC